MLRSHRRTMIPPSRQGRHKGQSLVEFALVFPLFIVLLLSIIEFMFLFNAQLSLNYATRDAALVAAEAGARPDADCLILQQIDRDLNAPTDETRVITVHIFSATETGGQLTVPKEQTYTRISGGGTGTTCDTSPIPSNTSSYLAGVTNYPALIRCSDLDRSTCSAGFTGPSNTGGDIIGVRIDYGYRFVTPVGSAMTLIGGGAPLWGGTGMTMSVGNAMRMEPIL